MSDKMRRKDKRLMLGTINVDADACGTIRISQQPGMGYMPLCDFFVIPLPSLSCTSSSSC
jgi:hypothetical protein